MEKAAEVIINEVIINIKEYVGKIEKLHSSCTKHFYLQKVLGMW